MNNLLLNYPELKDQKDTLNEAIKLIIDAFESNRKILIAGNGGSSADADHIVGEFMKGFVKQRPITKEIETKLKRYQTQYTDDLIEQLQMPLRAISLNGPGSLMSAFGNDVDSKYAIAQSLFGHADDGDIFLAISTSGNSENICAAAQVAKALNVKVIALTGAEDSSLSALADLTLRSPSNETFRVQEFHLPMYHTICLEVESHFFKL